MAWSDEIGLIDALPRASVEVNPWQVTTSLDSNRVEDLLNEAIITQDLGKLAQ
jgi:hypothetical protein